MLEIIVFCADALPRNESNFKQHVIINKKEKKGYRSIIIIEVDCCEARATGSLEKLDDTL